MISEDEEHRTGESARIGEIREAIINTEEVEMGQAQEKEDWTKESDEIQITKESVEFAKVTKGKGKSAESAEVKKGKGKSKEKFVEVSEEEEEENEE